MGNRCSQPGSRCGRIMLSLRSTFILIFTLLVAAPLAMFWAWPHSNALQHEVAEVKDRHLLLARNIGGALKRYHRDTTGAFDFVADTLLAGKAQPDTKALLANLGFRSVCQFDGATGRLIKGHTGTTSCPPAMSPATFTLLTGLAVEGRTVMSPVHAGSSGAPVICWVRRHGKWLIVGAIDTSYFVEHGRSIAFGIKGHAVIVDQTGRTLAHPVPAWEREMRDLSKLAPVVEMLAGKTGITTFYSPALKDDMIAGYSSVEGAGWGVMVPQPISELRDAANKSYQSATSLFAMSLLVAALVACRAAMTLLNPVTNVIEAARAMAKGATDVRIPPTGPLAPRELAALTRSFNSMAENVARARKGESEARQIAEDANRSKTDFLRTVTHELRSPLNAVVGFSEILASGKSGSLDSAASRTCIEDIRSGSKLLLSLTNDLLDLARIEAGQYELVDSLVDLAEIAGRAARFVQPMAADRGCRVHMALAADFPAVLGDERALFQCVLNLTTNAVKYGRAAGEITITGDIRADGGLTVTVADDGPGIAAEDLERVLEPFERIACEANRDVRGTGLGLPIVKKLVALHGGTFRLESRLGDGTRAIIALPASRVIDESQSAEPVQALPVAA